MEVHQKLIQQLDVCQEQELAIIDLTKKIITLEQHSQDLNSQSLISSNLDADVSRDSQSPTKNSFYQNKNC